MRAPTHIHPEVSPLDQSKPHAYGVRTVLGLDDRRDTPAEGEPAVDEHLNGGRDVVDAAQLREVDGEDDVEKVELQGGELSRVHLSQDLRHKTGQRQGICTRARGSKLTV